MDKQNLKDIIKDIVKKTCFLKNKYINQKEAPVSYVAIFCQNDEEYEEFTKVVKTFSSIINETPTGFHYKIDLLIQYADNFKFLKLENLIKQDLKEEMQILM